jgi:hypothetical protein
MRQCELKGPRRLSQYGVDSHPVQVRPEDLGLAVPATSQ